LKIKNLKKQNMLTKAAVVAGAIGGCVGVGSVLNNFTPTPKEYKVSDCPQGDYCDHRCEENHVYTTIRPSNTERFVRDVFRFSGYVIGCAFCGTIGGVLVFPFLAVAAPVSIPYFAYTRSNYFSKQ